MPGSAARSSGPSEPTEGGCSPLTQTWINVQDAIRSSSVLRLAHILDPTDFRKLARHALKQLSIIYRESQRALELSEEQSKQAVQRQAAARQQQVLVTAQAQPTLQQQNQQQVPEFAAGTPLAAGVETPQQARAAQAIAAQRTVPAQRAAVVAATSPQQARQHGGAAAAAAGTHAQVSGVSCTQQFRSVEQQRQQQQQQQHNLQQQQVVQQQHILQQQQILQRQQAVQPQLILQQQQLVQQQQQMQTQGASVPIGATNLPASTPQVVAGQPTGPQQPEFERLWHQAVARQAQQYKAQQQQQQTHRLLQQQQQQQQTQRLLQQQQQQQTQNLLLLQQQQQQQQLQQQQQRVLIVSSGTMHLPLTAQQPAHQVAAGQQLRPPQVTAAQLACPQQSGCEGLLDLGQPCQQYHPPQQLQQLEIVRRPSGLQVPKAAGTHVAGLLSQPLQQQRGEALLLPHQFLAPPAVQRLPTQVAAQACSPAAPPAEGAGKPSALATDATVPPAGPMTTAAASVGSKRDASALDLAPLHCSKRPTAAPSALVQQVQQQGQQQQPGDGLLIAGGLQAEPLANIASLAAGDVYVAADVGTDEDEDVEIM